MTADELREHLDDEGIEVDQRAVVARWLARGDGVAVYRNEDFGSPELGHRQFVSYGSAAAQLEVAEPPTRLPDIGHAINYRYQLVGTYKGDPL